MALLSNLRWKINTLIESTIASSNLSVRYASQIILLQVLYYLSASVIFRVTYAVLGWSYSAGVLLNWTDISVENTFGLTLILLWLFNALVSVVIVTLIIGRSKLVWDFVITIHFLHFVLVWIANGIPKNIYWWLLQIISSVFMIVLGTYLTRKIELRDTFFENMTDIELANSKWFPRPRENRETAR